MAAIVGKEGFDLGISTTDGERLLAFYRDVIGFEHEGDIAMEALGIKVMHRLWFGKSLLKIVVPVDDPQSVAAPGGFRTATGLRYFTITVKNLAEVLADVEASGNTVLWQPREVRPGVTVGLVEDPDGNWLEFIQAS
jgi:glyoxylase I family protein